MTYENLKSNPELRETDDEEEEEEMKYLLKGINQSLDQCIWSVTKWWPRVRAILLSMKEDIEKQSTNDVKVTLRKDLFPKLNAHYEDLKKENADECIFKGVELLPGWMVVKETHEIDRVTRKKWKVIEWADRTPADCLEDLASLCQTVADKMDSRYMKCVTNAVHVLGGCFHIPDVLCLLQRSTGSEFSAHQRTALNAYGNAEFESFFN